MLTIKQIHSNNKTLLKNYREYLKVIETTYAFEKKLIDEINHLQAINKKLFFLTPLQKKTIL